MSDKKWLLTGVKRTRVHEIRLLADSAEEAIALAKGGYRFSKVTSCEEDPPVRLGRHTSFGVLAANDHGTSRAPGYSYLRKT